MKIVYLQEISGEDVELDFSPSKPLDVVGLTVDWTLDNVDGDYCREYYGNVIEQALKLLKLREAYDLKERLEDVVKACGDILRLLHDNTAEEDQRFEYLAKHGRLPEDTDTEVQSLSDKLLEAYDLFEARDYTMSWQVLDELLTHGVADELEDALYSLRVLVEAHEDDMPLFVRKQFQDVLDDWGLDY